MANKIGPLPWQTPIVEPDSGKPSPFFIRLWQESFLRADAFDATVDSLEAGKADKSIVLTAGAGLTGGGDLSANRTFDVANTTVTPGSYSLTNLTVNSRGQITSASSGTVSGTLPTGGASGTILQKFSGADYAATWSTLTAGITAFTPTGTISSTDVQAAIAEVSGDVTSLTSTVATKLTGAAITSADALIPTLNSPWINYGGGFGGARYYKDAAGIVHIEGLIQAAPASPTSGVTLFTLLAGYRPPDTVMFVTYNGGGAGRIDVDSSGNVIMQSGNTAFTSLSGISFVPA